MNETQDKGENNMVNSKKNREIPIVDIAGVPFYADAFQFVYREVADPTNEIWPYEMLVLEDHYELLFDKKRKCAHDGEVLSGLSTEVDLVWLRPLMAVDPEGMELAVQYGKCQFREHYQDPLPTINIGGTDFYIDPIRKGFREVENRWNIILFTDVVPSEQPTIYFDTKVKNVPFPHELETYKSLPQMPANIKLVELPRREEMKKLMEMIKPIQNDIAAGTKTGRQRVTGRRRGL